MPRLLLLLAMVMIPVAALLLLMMSMQTQLLFPTDAVPPAGPLPPNGRPIHVMAASGDLLQGVHLQPSADARPSTLIVGFGGNAWNAQMVAELLHETFPESHVVAFHYRGYRPSTGSPSAEALLADAQPILDHALAQVRPERTIAVGFSIGSGVAASLADKVDGLILVTPFDSLKAVAGELYPWLPLGPFFEHEIAAASYIENSPVPVAILAADRDEIISTARTDALRQRVPNLVFDRTIASSGHNDIYERPEFRAGMRSALAAVTPN